jgi:bifunctional DNA-binding transcriptional regulator/antitoxin component of YhaV-PrlF toxin-antitoxin module
MTTITKATTKGQITLPISWRKKFSTDRYLIKDRGDKLEIRPVNLERLKNSSDYTVFDAIRDNRGKGILAKDIVKILEKIK